MLISTIAPYGSVPSGHRFDAAEIAFALAWQHHAPGLGGWSVCVDAGPDGAQEVLVDPPLVFGDGFRVMPDAQGATITWTDGFRRVASLREAMLLICPLSAEALAMIEQQAGCHAGATTADDPAASLFHAAVRPADGLVS